MNEPVTKQRPSIDIEEFERYMRESSAPPRAMDQDPLAELARLVGHKSDPYSDVFARQDLARQDSARQDLTRQHEGARQGADHAQAQASHHQDQAAPGLESAPRRGIDFAAIEAGLRGTLAAHEGEARHAPSDEGYDDARYAEQAHYDQARYDVQASQAAQEQFGWQDGGAPAVAAPRSRRPIYAMSAVILAGVIGVGVAFAYKGSNSGPREIAMIKAAPGPTKIQPPVDAAADQPARDSSLLDKVQQPAPVKTVTHEEQPVDLAQTVQSAPRDVSVNGIAPLYNFGPSDGNASSVPVPPSPGQIQAGQTQEASVQPDSAAPVQKADPIGIASDIAPIRVKTRSYRPDGTPVPDDQTSAAAPPAPVKAPVAKTATPKSTTRIAAAPKPVATADDTAPDDAVPAAPAPHKAKPVKAPKPAKPINLASAETGDAAPAPVETATGGGFSVQLAAPGSEAEAKQTIARLSSKFSSELGGQHLGAHKAVSNGKTVFRVRTQSMTRDAANDVCQKLRVSGGACFVAKN